MTSSSTLPRDVLERIAAQIGDSLTDAAREALAQGKGLTLAESFPVWFLGLDDTASSDASLVSLARPTGYWHHQIRHGGDVVEFAKSRPLGPSSADWQLEEIVTSPIAKGIEDALKWVETNVKDEGDVRLLVIPAFFIHALWLLTGPAENIVIADMPQGLDGLDYERLYSPNEMLRLLASNKHITGLPER